MSGDCCPFPECLCPAERERRAMRDWPIAGTVAADVAVADWGAGGAWGGAPVSPGWPAERVMRLVATLRAGEALDEPDPARGLAAVAAAGRLRAGRVSVYELRRAGTPFAYTLGLDLVEYREAGMLAYDIRRGRLLRGYMPVELAGGLTGEFSSRKVVARDPGAGPEGRTLHQNESEK